MRNSAANVLVICSEIMKGRGFSAISPYGEKISADAAESPVTVETAIF